jgi:hypothetical protein
MCKNVKNETMQRIKIVKNIYKFLLLSQYTSPLSTTIVKLDKWFVKHSIVSPSIEPTVIPVVLHRSPSKKRQITWNMEIIKP